MVEVSQRPAAPAQGLAHAGAVRLKLNIGTLALPGYSRLQAGRVERALHRVLGQLLAERGVPPGWLEGRAAGSGRALTLPARAARDADTMGEALAQALYEDG